MLKVIMCATRLPELTREQFDDHWYNHHAPLVRKHAAALGIRKYVQTVPLMNVEAQRALQKTRGCQPVDFDACGELWWDDMESHLAARKTAEGAKAILELIEDERRFVDLSRSQLWYCEERAIL
jgi:hypothetical protein